MVMRATTITMEPVQAEGWAETAGVLAVLGEEEDTGAGDGQLIAGLSGAAGSAIGGPYGSLLAGAGQLAGALVGGKAQRGGDLGSSIGQLAGGAIGTFFGGSAGAALGGAAGQLTGKLIGGAVEGATKKRGPSRAQARQRARAKVAARVNQARAETPPAAPTTPTKAPPPAAPTTPPKAKPAEAPVSAKRDTPPAPQPEPPRAPQFPPLLLGFRDKLTDEQRGRLDQAIREKRGAAAVQDILAERSSVEAMEAELARQSAAPTFVQPPPPVVVQPTITAPPLVMVPTIAPPATLAGAEPAIEEEIPEYDDAAAPPARRPRPRLHVGLIPLQRWQLEALLVKVPALRKLDTRLLRAMTGNGSTVRDTAGIDAATRTYRAEPGETALGIAKKLTGKGERAADLLAANPGHRDEDPVWRIPPGWMHFTTTGDETESDTGATGRLYIVQKNDTPVGIATRSGAKAARPKWWNELKTANPQIPTTDNGNNFERFFAGDQLWIPDEWPQSPMFPQAGTGPAPMPSPQPNPSPQPTPQANTTMDPGVFVQAQALLALWALMNPGASNPPDYGSTPSDITGTTTTRFTSALASFQNWYNAKNAGAKLRTDGILDPLTYQALHAATAGTLTPPGPGGVPWSQPAPQGQPTPQGGVPGMPGLPGLPWGQPAPQQGQPAPQGGVPGMPGLPGLPWGQPAPQGGGNGPQGVPGINGGLPQLGGWGAPVGPNSIPILIQTIFRDGPTPSTPGPALPSNVIGAQVPGWPPGSTIAADQSIQYNGQPVPVGQQVPGMAPGVLWANGGMMTYQGIPYLPYNPIPNVPGFVWSPYIPNYRVAWMPETWVPYIKSQAAQGFPQAPQQQAQPQAQQQPQKGEPKKDSGAVLPLLLAAATIAFS